MDASSSYYSGSSRRRQYESPDPYNGDSSRYSGTYQSGGSGGGSHRKRRHRSRSRSSSPDRNRSSIYAKGKTASEYEVRNHALSTQLAMANSQILTLDAEVNTAKNAKLQADNRLLMMQQENNALQARNVEILQVMKTLEKGVEALQKEKNDMMATNDELNEKLENQGKSVELLDEQIISLNDRNATLSKKCVDMLEGSKDAREKSAKYEIELQHLRPQNELLKKELETLKEEHGRLFTRVATFEMREKIWINEKSELGSLVNEAMERAKRAEQQQQSSAAFRHPHSQQQQRPAQGQQLNNGTSNYDGDRKPASVSNEPNNAHVEVIKKFQLLIDSLQTHYRSQLGCAKAKLKDVIQQQQQKNPISSVKAEPSKSPSPKDVPEVVPPSDSNSEPPKDTVPTICPPSNSSSASSVVILE